MPLPDGDEHYVTRGEFARELQQLEKSMDQKLELTENRLQKWILGGILAFILSTGIGGFSAYASLMSQLQQIATASEAAARANERLDDRAQWIVDQERHDSAQDQILSTISPTYDPPDRGQIPQ
ncbi:MAG TPA: hypothetical protein VM531_11980 [Sphingomicrobium sp.]|nr:hypothetical protein [Sphingomicrobium sp.]